MQLQDKVIQGFRLSPQQKRLWLLHQESRGAAAPCPYQVQGAILIEGNIKKEVLKVALQQVSDRHEILRTNFRRPLGVKTPVQVIADSSLLLWREINLSTFRPEQQLTQFESFLEKEKSLNGELEQTSLLRLCLFKLSAEKHILLVTLSALCADNWTLNNLVQEIGQSYDACLKGEEISEEVVQYVQFSEWQNQLLEDEDAEVGKYYWNQVYRSDLISLKLPFEAKAVTPNRFLEVKSFEWKIDPNTVAKIETLAQQYDIDTSVFLLTCWQILLWKFIGQADIVIATASHGRKYEELEAAIGLFSKYLPLTCNLQADSQFNELLTQVDETVKDISQWEEYFSWEQIEELSSFPFSFDFVEQPEKYAAAEVSFSIYKQYACIDKFKVKLSCTRQEDSLIAAFHYDANLFSAEDIQRLAGHLQTLVNSAIAHPEAGISQLEILSDRDRHQILTEFNNTQADYPTTQCIHQLFEEQAKRTPNNIAVVFEDRQLTYAELNARANQLAHHLQKLGVKPEVLVGICLERSLDILVGILGILKAGGAYLPIDPALPAQSIAFRLQDAQAPILLTHNQLVKELPEQATQIVYLDTDWDVIAQQNTENPSSNVIPKNLAYTIYTSGSTGKPKGVAVEHQQLLNYLDGILERLDLPLGASFAIVSTFAADLGNTAIFSSLSTGGCLHIVSSERAADPEALADYCRRHPIDCLKIVPSHLKALLASSYASDILPQQRLILGGETASWDLIEQIQKHSPQCLIFNHYGPTEATVGVLTYQVQNRVGETVPLGRPIPNTQIYLLDKHLQPVPIGVPGELYIGGASLARGYLNRPELTQEKFIPNPFCDQPRSRLYKTGDTARYLPDGNIEFIGRIDHQVKIRGYRIELGEIEALLSQHQLIREAVVVVREDEPGNARLVAYIVPRQTPNINEIRNFLKEKLPEYMMPSAFIVLKTLPLTPNGKVDRQALPTPDHTRPELAETFVAPRTPVEEALTEIWMKVLGLEKIGIHDNFFDLGGHSLLVTQLLAKVREAFQVELPLRSLFEAPTIAALAESIENAHQTKSSEKIASDTAVDLNAEAVLDPTICPKSLFYRHTTEPTAILLTGATGFLGSFLLYELLQQSQADIYCLVRASNAELGKQKIQSSLELYSIWNESFQSRIIPVIGELSKPLLGLSEQQFREMASIIDAIYHNGAFVNFTFPYSVLKAANVLGTQEILRLASQLKIKPVHFISSTSVAVPAGNNDITLIREQYCADAHEVLEGGYIQSKWVAEKLVNIAGDRGLPVSIYRPGRVAGHSKTGACNPDDHTFRTIKGCIQLGSAPKRNAMVNIMPVDYVSQAIVHLSKQQESLGKTFHLVNPNPAQWNEFVSWICTFGYPLQQISENEWQTELLKVAERSPSNALYPLLPVVSQKVSEEPTSNSAELKFDCQNTLNGLAGTSIVCPPVNVELLRTYFSYLIDNSFLHTPTSEIELKYPS
ncbi:MAG: amino acid adenylation domain-containing protein [Aphanothece sp. CMT-3BRIN-NPC111]|jgi:amino acid adenylation domain-containing protein/thioester reductase-like protein|nr:amino acid adenylation domain-containing protein [Aphanothece sp. CMT-3BRIN-NPC111]